MTRTLIGLDNTGVACVKITKGNIDPFTEPDANYGSFYYNSKWFKDFKLDTILKMDPPATGSFGYLPQGATAATYQVAIDGRDWTQTGNYANTWVVRNTFFPALPYALPLYDYKYKRLSDGRFVEQARRRTQSASDKFGREAGYYTMTEYGRWYANKAVYRPGLNSGVNSPLGTPGNCFISNRIAAGFQLFLIVWSAPGDNQAPLNSAPQSPVPGQRTVEITKDYCRVAKPGYDVRTAVPTQLAFDSSRRPASVIKGGDIDLPVGVNQFDLGFPVTPNMVCDMILYQDQIVFPMSQYGSALVAEYWFSGTSLFIQNTSAACRCRFIVMAFDDQPPSAGANKVLRQINVNGQNVVQFLRPGSADPPAFKDIVLDSRWPSLQILAEGYQTIALQGNRDPLSNKNTGNPFTVNFDANGLFPFVKYVTIRQTSEGNVAVPAMTFINESHNNSSQYHRGNSSYCALGAGSATFYTFAGNPVLETVNSANTGFDYVYADDPIIGIHYFILGIAI
jgi:hypothetical protein